MFLEQALGQFGERNRKPTYYTDIIHGETLTCVEGGSEWTPLSNLFSRAVSAGRLLQLYGVHKTIREARSKRLRVPMSQLIGGQRIDWERYWRPIESPAPIKADSGFLIDPTDRYGSFLVASAPESCEGLLTSDNILESGLLHQRPVHRVGGRDRSTDARAVAVPCSCCPHLALC